jgi:hypothetical protein
MQNHHRTRPSLGRAWTIAVTALAVGAAVFLVTGAMGRPSTPSVPAALDAPSGLSGDDLHAWCVGRLDSGTDGLSTADVGWLQACADASAPIGDVTPSPSTTTTPPGSPTTPPSGSTSAPTPPSATTPVSGGCLAKPSACGFPDATNTGVPAGKALTAHSGDVIINQPGFVMDGWNLTGCVEIMASNVVIRNSHIRCDGAFGVHNDTRNSATNVLIQDTEIDCGNSSGTAVAGHNITSVRLNVHGCENGFAGDDNTAVKDSYVWGFYNSGTGHTDGVQTGGHNVLIQHDTIVNADPAGTSAIITDPSQVVNLTITGNLLSSTGSYHVLYCPRYTASGVVITNNRFGQHDYVYCDVTASIWSGNVLDSTGATLSAS